MGIPHRRLSGPLTPPPMLHHGSPGMGYSRHDLMEVREVLLRGVQVQHGAGMPAQLPVPGDAAGLRRCEKREMCPGASNGAGTGVGCVCRATGGAGAP